MLSVQWKQVGPAVIGAGFAFLVVFVIALLNVSSSELNELVLFLLYSSVPSLTIGYLIFVTGQFRLKYIQLKILLAYGLGVAITLINIYVTSRLMFLSVHDFFLLGLLLIFAGLLSTSFGITLAASITYSLQTLKQGTQALAQGDLTARVSLPYTDEFSDVAEAFNIMAFQLEASFNRQQALEQARRDLVAAVSHDLRTPLASMRAMVEAISDEVVTDEKTISRYHQTIQHQVTNLSHLIDEFFELSKLDSGKLELRLDEISLSDLISDTLESMRAQALARQLNLTGQVEPGLPTVMVESAQIQRVLYNLVQNAIRHTPIGGMVAINAHSVDSLIQVDVIDTGEGIADEDLPRIFDAFYRGDKSRNRSTGGSGLGLAIARGIVEAHGGRIWVESKPDVGSTFSFVLPIATPERV